VQEKVTVIVPTRNEEKFIRKCMDSLLEQSYPGELYEIFVCDGMSTDGTRDIVCEYSRTHQNVKLIDNPGITAPRGMNTGIKSSNADIVIIFGAHSYADREFIENNVKALRNENVGCTGGTIETVNENEKGKAIAAAMSSPFGVGNALFRYSKKEAFVDTVAFGAYKAAVLKDVGYFDEELVRNQDDELNLRVTESGYKILLSPAIKSFYYSRASLKKLWKQYYQYGFWKVRVIQKHGSLASLRHLIPFMFVSGNVLGAAAGVFISPVLILWIAEVILYLVCDIIFSIRSSKGKLSLAKYLLLIFPILHISYGIGFIEGLFSFYVLKSQRNIGRNTKTSR
jgi:glycosyltransferase involved in cell wall biosynthesis